MTGLLTRPSDDTDPPRPRLRLVTDRRRVLRAAERIFDRLHVVAHLADGNGCGAPCRPEAAGVARPQEIAAYGSGDVGVVEVPAGTVAVFCPRVLYGELLDDVFVGRVEVEQGVTVDRSVSVSAVLVFPFPRGDSPV